MRQKNKTANYLLLNIDVRVNQYENSYKDILIDFDSIELLTKKINEFVKGPCDEIHYLPLEEDFELRVLPNKITKEEILIQMERAGMSELCIKEIKDQPETYSLIFMLDNAKYDHDIVTNTGIAYWIKVTKSDLAEFAAQWETEYTLLKS